MIVTLQHFNFRISLFGYQRRRPVRHPLQAYASNESDKQVWSSVATLLLRNSTRFHDKKH